MTTQLCSGPITLVRRSSAAFLAVGLFSLSGQNPTAAALAALASGAAAIDQAKYRDALPPLKEAQQGLPLVADYPAYLTGAALYELNEYSGIEHVLGAVWDHTPTSPLRGKATILAANALIRDGKPKRAATLVEEHLADLTPPQTESLLAHAFDAAGDSAQAAKHFQQLYIEYPLAPDAADAEAALARLAAQPSRQARFSRCLKLLDGSDYARAHTELLALISDLTGVMQDLARVKAGVAEFSLKSYGPASTYLAALHVQSPEADAERLYYLIQCARRMDNAAAFLDILARLAELHPKSIWRLQALLSVGEFYFFYNQVDAYAGVYRACSADFPTHPLAAECQWRLAFTEYMHRGPNARAMLSEFVQRRPASDRVPDALYFLGRLAESKSEWSAAKSDFTALIHLYPNNYHAALARRRIERAEIRSAPASSEVTAWLNPIHFRPRPPLSFAPSAVTQVRIERAKLLATGKLNDLAESELRFGAKTDGQPQIMALELAELANAANTPDLAIRYIKQLAPAYLYLPAGSASERFWKLAFPLPFKEPVERYAREHQLDPYIVAALIRQESEFNPTVVSRARAYGLTQVLPSTGRELSRRLGIRPFREDMLFVPDINLRIGIYFLRSLYDRLQGQWEATLASYNAGPGRVAKWLTWGEFQEPAEFVEMIPFAETRNYVQIVLRNAEIYRTLYGKPAQPQATR